MSKRRQRQPASIGDRLALEIQELHRTGKLPDTQPLLRLDQRKEAAAAPFQFDTVRGRLHRTGCRFIPVSSRSAVYGVWEFRPSEQHLACPRCKPVPARRKKGSNGSEDPAADMLYGLLSILDQFGGVLRERGREYRHGQYGQQVRDGVQDLYERLGSGERDVLHVIASALDGLSSMVNNLQRSLDAPNGRSTDGEGANGRTDGNGAPPARRPRLRRSRNGTDEP